MNVDGSTVAKPSGEPLVPDHGLLFPTADPDILLLRQGVAWRPAPFHELAAHAFEAGTPDGDRMTIVATQATEAAWWGAVPGDASFTSACESSGAGLHGGTLPGTGTAVVKVADLFEAVVGRAPTGPDELFEVYPFLKEGVFLERAERSDWYTFSKGERPGADAPECGDRPAPDQGPGGDEPRILRMAFHVAALQAAIERSAPPSGALPGTLGEVTVGAGTYALDRHLVVRTPRRIVLPDASDPVGATFELGVMRYPQGAALLFILSWVAFPGAGVACDNGAFCDEHVYGEPIPALRFDLDASGETPSFLIPAPLAEVQPALLDQEMFFRIGRTDNDSVEPFVSVWRQVANVEDVGGTASRVVLAQPLPEVPVMTMTLASAVMEQGADPETGTCDGINFETGVWRVGLTAGLTKALKAHNPGYLSVPTRRTVLTWTDPNDATVRVVTRVVKNKVCTDGAVTTNQEDYVVGTDYLRLCVDANASQGTLGPGLVAEWSREAWAMLPLTDPDGSRLEGRLTARNAAGGNEIGGAVQAYNVRDLHIEDVVAETVAGAGASARLDRAVILTTTRDATVDSARVETPRPFSGGDNKRTWALDMQHTKRTVAQGTQLDDGFGGGVQFEQTAGDRVGETRGPQDPPALDVTLRDPGTSNIFGTTVSTTYTSDDCAIGRVRVAPAEAIAPDPNDVFERSRYPLVGVTGQPTVRDPEVELRIRALDLGVDMTAVRPFYLDPVSFGDSGQNAFIYRDPQGGTVWASQTVQPVSGVVPLPTGTHEPVVVVVPGVARRISALLPVNKKGTSSAILYHRQGGSAIISTALTPSQGREADEALQVYTGLGWREYGLLIALPDASGWTAGDLSWNAEVLRAGGAGETPPAIGVFGVVPATLGGLVSGDSQPELSDKPPLPSALQRASFLAGLRISLTDSQGQPATVTQGRLVVTVAAQRRVSGSGAAFESSGSQFFVAGPDVDLKANEILIDLVGDSVAVAPARGTRGYWPGGADLERRLRVDVDTGPVVVGGLPFQLSGSGAHTLQVECLVSA